MIPTAYLAAAAALLIPAPIPPAPGGVIVPAKGFGSRAISIEQDGSVHTAGPRDGLFAAHLATSLPPSDRHKFNLTIYVDQKTDPESIQIVRDFQQHPALRRLAEWCKFRVIDRNASQGSEARAMAAALAGRKMPAVLVYSHPAHPVFGEAGPGGWQYVFQRAGYGGDAALMARQIFTALRKAYKENGVEQCPGPYCPSPRHPVTPSPDQPWPIEPIPPADAQPDPAAIDWSNPYAWPPLLQMAALALVLIVVARLLRGAAIPVEIAPTPKSAPPGPRPDPPARTPPPKAGPAAAVALAIALSATPAIAADGHLAPPQDHPAMATAAESDGPAATPVEQAYHYPPRPEEYEWLDNVIRDEVRRGLNDVEGRVEGMIARALADFADRVCAAIAQFGRAVCGQIKTLMMSLLALAILSVINCLLAIRRRPG